MKHPIWATLLVLATLFACQNDQKKLEPFPLESKSESEQPKSQVFGVVIHGGAGSMRKGMYSDSTEKAYHEKLAEAARAAYKVLEEDGKSTDAIVAALSILEDSPLFNAGKGAVFAHDATNQLDASIMDGKSLEAGAVAGLRNIQSPIKAAQLVLEKSPHVLLSGKGAYQFAREQGLDSVPDSYFFVQGNYDRLQKILEEEKAEKGMAALKFPDSKYGTVGCVVLDKSGNLAAGTSTGGMTNKKFGRIGDSPIIGAGTYADKNVAISCTGHGEYFIRYAVAYDLAAQIKYQDAKSKDAGDAIIYQKLKNAGGDGGLISIDKEGNVNMPYNTSGMFRASLTSESKLETAIYEEVVSH